MICGFLTSRGVAPISDSRVHRAGISKYDIEEEGCEIAIPVDRATYHQTGIDGPIFEHRPVLFWLEPGNLGLIFEQFQFDLSQSPLRELARNEVDDGNCR